MIKINFECTFGHPSACKGNKETAMKIVGDVHKSMSKKKWRGVCKDRV